MAYVRNGCTEETAQQIHTDTWHTQTTVTTKNRVMPSFYLLSSGTHNTD